MADKEVVIKVTTETDAQQLEDLQDKLEETNATAEVLGETGSESLEQVGESAEETSESLDNTKGSAEELNGELDNVNGDGLDSAKQSSDELGDSLDNTNDKVNEIADSMGLMEGVMLMDVANQVGAMGDSAEGMAQEMNTASITVGQLAKNVGVAEPEMVNLINYISNATFPHDEAMAYVNALNQMGVSANQLGASATDMDRINDAFHIGSDGAIKLTQGLQAVGVSADNLPSAFNALAYAQTNVTGGVETYSMALQRQGRVLNEYGINADQLAIILGKLSERGLSQRQINQELSESLKEANGDVSALEQSLGLEAGTLESASAYTSQYEGHLQSLADEEKEHKTFIDQINAGWEDMQLKLSPLLSPLMSVVGIIGSFGQFALAVNSILTLAETFGILKTATLTTIPSQIAEGFAGWFSIGWIALAIILGIALGLAILYLLGYTEEVTGAILWFGESLQWLAQEGINALINLITYVNNWEKGLINSFLKAGSDAVNGFLNWIMQLPSRFRAELNKMLQDALNFAGRLPQIIWDVAIQTVTGWITGTGEHSPGFMSNAFEGELKAMKEDASQYGKSINENIALTGTSLRNSLGTVTPKPANNTDFANNLLIETPTTNTNNSNQPTMIFNIDYLAKKEFVDEIVEIIQKNIMWDNETAGRTV